MARITHASAGREAQADVIGGPVAACVAQAGGEQPHLRIEQRVAFRAGPSRREPDPRTSPATCACPSQAASGAESARCSRRRNRGRSAAARIRRRWGRTTVSGPAARRGPVTASGGGGGRRQVPMAAELAHEPASRDQRAPYAVEDRIGIVRPVQRGVGTPHRIRPRNRARARRGRGCARSGYRRRSRRRVRGRPGGAPAIPAPLHRAPERTRRVPRTAWPTSAGPPAPN